MIIERRIDGENGYSVKIQLDTTKHGGTLTIRSKLAGHWTNPDDLGIALSAERLSLHGLREFATFAETMFGNVKATIDAILDEMVA